MYRRKNILVTLDSNYIEPLHVMLYSLMLNNPKDIFDVYMIYSNITDRELTGLKQVLQQAGSDLIPIYVEAEAFAEAPVLKHYTKAMYYRLLAFELLPSSLKRILYLDPDILVINSIDGLYDLDIADYLYAGAMHDDLMGITKHINRVRLKNYEAEAYFNSGVLMMNLEKQRQQVKEADIFGFVKAHYAELLLPDQDILNGLYGHDIREVDDSIYNYDARKYETYLLESLGERDVDWVIAHTVFLHFCGKSKPWQKNYPYRFGALYKHYRQLAIRDLERIGSDFH